RCVLSLEMPMAREDREHSFEQALARQLRSDAASRFRVPRRECADAETLAAYHERVLPPDEMILWNAHIGGCSRCQEILTHIEQTDAIPVDLPLEQARVHAAESAPLVQISRPRPSRWLWAAPVGAIAAGLLVWMVVHQGPRPMEVAKNQSGPASLPRSP